MSQNNLYIDYIGLKYIDYDDKSDRNAVSWIYQNILPLFTDAWQFTPECIKNIDLNAYKDKYCVYLIKIRHNTYKYGDSYLVRKRLHAHKSNIGSFEYVKIYTFDDFNDMKKMAKSIKQYTINNNIAYRDIHDRVELFKTDNISSIMEDIDLLYKTHYKNRDALPQSKLYYETLVNLNKLKDTETAHKLVTYPELYPDPTLIKLNEICIIKIQENEKKEKELKKNQKEYQNLTREEKNIILQKRKTKNCLTCNIAINSWAEYCQKCCKISQRVVKNRPSKDKLLKMIKATSYVAVGKKYGVSDNAVRKWLK